MINVDGNREAKNSLKNCIKKRLHSSLVCKSVNKIDYKIPIFDVTNVNGNLIVKQLNIFLNCTLKISSP